MYRIIYWNLNTHTEIGDYGFTRWTLNRIKFLIDQDERFEIVFIEPLIWNWSIFKKCWKNESEIIYQK